MHVYIFLENDITKNLLRSFWNFRLSTKTEKESPSQYTKSQT